MSSCKVNYMDKVSHGRSIRCIPVGAEDVQHGTSPGEDSGNHRDQVARLLSRIFTQNSGFMTADLYRTSVNMALHVTTNSPD